MVNISWSIGRVEFNFKPKQKRHSARFVGDLVLRNFCSGTFFSDDVYARTLDPLVLADFHKISEKNFKTPDQGLTCLVLNNELRVFSKNMVIFFIYLGRF